MIKVNCICCGFNITLDDSYDDYEGQVKCFTCSALLEVKLVEGMVKSVKTPHAARSREDQGHVRERHEETAQHQIMQYGADSSIPH
jgi:hypothetical protein